MAFSLLSVFLVCFLLLIFTVNGQPPEGNGFDGDAFDPVNPESEVAEDRMNQTCDPRFRTFDGSCTNDRSPDSQLFGSAGLAQFTYFGRGSTTTIRRNDLPSTRFISNMLAQQSMDVRESRGLNELVTFFGQFIDHTLVATPVNDGRDETPVEPFFISVPDDDPMLANITGGQLRFFRSRRARFERRSNEERPINTLTSVLDLASVYGPSDQRAEALRDLQNSSDGLMKTGPNNLLPTNSEGLSNEPNPGPEFFVAGDSRSSEHPVLTSLHTVFLREHNDIARELKEKFPDFSAEELFQNARQINIAQFQKIVFDEWYPAITGRNLPPYRGFRGNEETTVSVLFSTAAFRVGHTLVNNEVTVLGPQNSPMPPLSFTDIFFENVNLVRNIGVESLLRGALNTGAQEIDLMVVDALRNFLFSNVAGVSGLDLIALNLQRGRDHGLLPYNIIRQRFSQGRATSFSQITSNTNIQSALQTVYRSVDRVEAWIGLMAEDHAPTSSMGPTMLAIWQEEFRRLRDGDRFYYENRDQYDPEVLARIPRLSAIFNGQDTLRAVLLRNTDVTSDELPSRTFFAN